MDECSKWIKCGKEIGSVSPCFEKSAMVVGAVKRAVAKISAMGVYKLYINGKQIGNAVLAPGFTSYPHRVLYQVYDITGQLTAGENRIRIVGGKGWAMSRFGNSGFLPNNFADHISVIAELEIEYGNGKTEKIPTDTSWECFTTHTKTTDQLLPSFTEKSGDTETIITAKSLDCQGFYTAVIENIPKEIGLFSITVTPYVVVDGKKTTGETKTIVMENQTVFSSATLSLKEHINEIKVFGRSLDVEDGIACDFSASGIEFNAIVAGDLSIAATCNATTYYTVYLNGVRQPDRLKMTSGTGEYTVAKNLAVGQYNVRLVKQTHIGLSNSTLSSITINGRLTEKPKDRELLIEFIGDNIG